MPRKDSPIWRDFPTDFLDIGMEPLFKVRKRDDTIHYVSAADALLHKQFEDALAGDLASFRAIINMAKKNLRYTNLKRAYVGANQLRTVAYQRVPREGEKRADFFSRDAGTILDIMVQVKEPGDLEMVAAGIDYYEYYFHMQPWVLEAAATRQSSGGEPEDLSHYCWSPHGVIDPFDYTNEPWFAPPPAEQQRSPEETRFKKGCSGNPRGRPKKKRAYAPFDEFLFQIVTINVGGTKRECSRLEGLVHSGNMRAAKGDTKFLNYLSGLYVEESLNRWNHSEDWEAEGVIDPLTYLLRPYIDSSFDRLPCGSNLRRLDIISRGTSSRYLFRPWLIELALSRLGNRQLTIEEQKEVMRSTSCRRKVNWPDWWEVRPWEKGGHKL
ncbi:hypothetical protein GCM10023208_04860 [Erythrobacter westpacificensis]|uniref:DUF5681 domain-containing protein n=1 Tax=Erythrobacter westpacificensis TaxID=1055231 RepID=A0ABP9K2C9_9SPHN